MASGLETRGGIDECLFLVVLSQGSNVVSKTTDGGLRAKMFRLPWNWIMITFHLCPWSAVVLNGHLPKNHSLNYSSFCSCSMGIMGSLWWWRTRLCGRQLGHQFIACKSLWNYYIWIHLVSLFSRGPWGEALLSSSANSVVRTES